MNTSQQFKDMIADLLPSQSEQDAFFASQRNMEFGQVFEQIESTLPKLGTKDRHEIFLKVDQEKIETPKAEEPKDESTKPE